MRPLAQLIPHVTVAHQQAGGWLVWAQRVLPLGRNGSQLWRFRGNAASVY